MLRHLVPLAAALSLLACATVGAGVDDGQDTADGETDSSITDASDAGSDLAADTPYSDAAPGVFGAPCTSNEGCRSGFCIEGPDGGSICTEFCTDECPDEEFECRLIENSGGDLVSICFPPYDDLCRECEFDRQCGGLADLCVSLADGNHCARDCSVGPECPTGFYCESFADGTQQCIPSDQTCTGCIDGDGDLYGDGPGCLGRDCDETNVATHEGAAELCDGRDNDCDLDEDEDFDLDTDPTHCGACGTACELANAVSGCSSGICFIRDCLPLYYDLNGIREDGCEYFCEFEDLSTEDRPDHLFRDTNCDGIDGDPGQAAFVSPTGDDTNPGTREAPWRTLAYAMTTVSESRLVDAIYVAEGRYLGEPLEGGGFAPIELVDGVNIYGGYESGTWRRSSGNVTRFGGASPAAIVRDFSIPTELAQIGFEGAAGTTMLNGSGGASIGLMIVDSEDLLLTGITAFGGTGGRGATGEAGRDGLPGAAGGAGGTGEVDSSGTCSSNPAPDRGTPGSSPCGSTGGRGGDAARSTGTGGTGDAGSGPGAGGGGAGGAGGSEDWVGGPTGSGTPGNPGGPGADGDPADPGAAGSAGTIFFEVGEVWTAAPGEVGPAGPAGGGAGGGGGGGGATGSCGGWLGVCDGYGGAGGGGGGGGCGGRGGTGGGGGGGSFGLYAIDSTLRVQHSQLTSGTGGTGGDGGRGGNGGSGGDPGIGGPSSCNGGTGGPGGIGGRGGRGGQGGGGAGGPSYPAVSLRSSIDFEATELTVGAGGLGGNGADEGATGEVRNFE